MFIHVYVGTIRKKEKVSFTGETPPILPKKVLAGFHVIITAPNPNKFVLSSHTYNQGWNLVRIYYDELLLSGNTVSRDSESGKYPARKPPVEAPVYPLDSMESIVK